MFFEKLVAEQNNKETEYQNEIKSLKKEHNQMQKDSQNKFDLTMR